MTDMQVDMQALRAERDRLRLALNTLLTAVERVAMTHRWMDSADSWESLYDLPPDVATLAIVVRAARAALAPDTVTLGTCVGHLGPPSNTASPHPKGPTCSLWSSCALAPDPTKEPGT